MEEAKYLKVFEDGVVETNVDDFEKDAPALFEKLKQRIGKTCKRKARRFPVLYILDDKDTDKELIAEMLHGVGIDEFRFVEQEKLPGVVHSIKKVREILEDGIA